MKFNSPEMREKALAARLVSKSYSNPIEKFFNKEKPNRNDAIKAKCAQCFGCEIDFIELGAKKDIQNCSDTGCALHRFRPYQKKGESDE